jgi:hypothetical protein
MDMAAHYSRSKTKLPTLLRLSLMALAFAASASAARAAIVRVGIDGGPSQVAPLNDACSTACTLDVYVDLDDGSLSPVDREASVFQVDFDLQTTGTWDVSLDMSAVDPEVDPIGVGSWSDAVGSLTSSRVSVSLTSDNLGGERLVLQLQLVPPAIPAVGDQLSLDLTSDSARIIVARDEGGVVLPVSLTDPAPDSPIAVVPEPAPGLMLAVGAAALVGLRALGHRDRVVCQNSNDEFSP